MIVKMNKACLLVLEHSKEETLKQLRNLGVMHIEYRSESSDALVRIEHMQRQVEAALKRLEVLQDGKLDEKNAVSTFNYEKSEKSLDRISSLIEREKELDSRIDAYKSDIGKLEPWGDFDPADIELLCENGYPATLHRVKAADVNKLGVRYDFIPLGRVGKETKIALFGDNGEESDPSAPPLPEPFKPPRFGISVLLEKIGELQGERIRVEDKLRTHLHETKDLSLLKQLCDQEHEFESVRSAMNGEEELAEIVRIEGYVPVSDCDRLKKTAAKYGWGICLRDPLPEENPPTLVRNSRPVAIIRPLFKLLEVIPGYREYDINVFFLLFLTLFFAMIIGDAGYGVLFALLGIVIQLKSGKANDLSFLLYLFGTATVVWGALTGTWFGSQTIAQIGFFRQFVDPRLASFPDLFNTTTADVNYNIMYFSFVIGTVHLSLAHLLGILKELPSFKSLFHLSRLSMVLGLYYVVLMLVLNITPLPAYSFILTGAGFLGVVLFGEQQPGQSFIRGVGKGAANLFTIFLDSVSCFADIISYIRLFAVGLATTAISTSFNGMAAPPLEEGPAVVFGILILLVGHVFNFTMASLAIIVHGVRLNLLEFSGHLEMEWSGFAYNPFEKMIEV